MDLLDDPKTFGNALQARFQSAGISQSQVARLIDESRSYVSLVLAGKLLPRAATLERMLALLPISSDEARDIYIVHAAIEAGMRWNTKRGKDVVSNLRDQGVLNQDARVIRDKSSPNTRRRESTSQPSRYVPKSGQPDPTGVSSPAELQQALQAVHVWGGSLSLRKLERLSNGMLRRSTTSKMLRGAEPLIPDYDRYLAFLRACGIDNTSIDTWVFTWRRLVALQQSPKAVGWMSGIISSV